MTQYLDSLTEDLQHWAKEYWAEGKVIVRTVPATQVRLTDGYDYPRRAYKVKTRLNKASWRKLLTGLMLSEDPKSYLEENRPYGHPTARIEL